MENVVVALFAGAVAGWLGGRHLDNFIEKTLGPKLKRYLTKKGIVR